MRASCACPLLGRPGATPNMHRTSLSPRNTATACNARASTLAASSSDQVRPGPPLVFLLCFCSPSSAAPGSRCNSHPPQLFARPDVAAVLASRCILSVTADSVTHTTSLAARCRIRLGFVMRRCACFLRAPILSRCGSVRPGAASDPAPPLRTPTSHSLEATHAGTRRTRTRVPPPPPWPDLPKPRSDTK